METEARPSWRAFTFMVTEAGMVESVLRDVRSYETEGVFEAHVCTGIYDIIADIRHTGPSVEGFRDLVFTKLQKTSGVESSTTFFAFPFESTEPAPKKPKGVIRAYVLVSCAAGHPVIVGETLTEKAGKEYGIVEALTLLGIYDVIAIIDAPRFDDLEPIITEEIQVMPGVTRTETFPVFR